MSVQDQHPIGTGLDAVSDAADALEGVDLTGRVALVTGGSSGLGSETVEAGGAMTGGVEPYAVDPEAAEQLWRFSSAITATGLPR